MSVIWARIVTLVDPRRAVKGVILSLLVLSGHAFNAYGQGVDSRTKAYPERLVAEGVIVGDATSSDPSRWPRAFLQVQLEGHAATLMVDFGWSSSELGLVNTPSDVVISPEGVGERGMLLIGTNKESFTHVEMEPQDSGTPRAPPGMPPYAGVLGMPVIVHYDVAFDDRTHRVRFYQPVPRESTATSAHELWLPPGITAGDCVPLQFFDDASPTGLPQLPVLANGIPMLSIFDSGSPYTIMNRVAADTLGLTAHSPNVHHVEQNGSYTGGGSAGPRYGVTGIALTLGSRRVPTAQILWFPEIPMAHASGQPILNLGLDAIHDRVLFFSFSGNTVCLST